MQDKQLFTDKPLTDPKADLLNYAPFAEALAKSICNMVPPDGLVLALHGPWGVGKSTLIEFVLHYIEQNCSKKEKPIIVRFNPWWFSGQENLIRHFFGQLYATLESKPGKGIRKLSSAIQDLSDVVAEAPVPGSKLPQAVAGKTLGRKQKSVTELKKNIVSILRNGKRRILVVIDDIDRLNAEEIQQLFAIIKSVADFPNVIYLLAFDRKIVAEVLSSQGLSGDRFLDKIVQVPFEIPSIGQDVLQKLLLEKIEDVFGEIPLGFYIQRPGELQSGYIFQLQHLINTPRKILRLVNTLTVTYTAVKNEVDPADFIAIEALRVFEPEIYDVIRTNKALFTGRHIPAEMVAAQGIMQNKNENIQKLVEQLFPNWKSPSLALVSRLRKQLRVSSPDIFDVYFRFSLANDDVSHQELKDIIVAIQEGNKVGERFAELARNNVVKCRKIFDRLLDGHLGELRIDVVVGFIRELFDVGDDIIKLGVANPKSDGHDMLTLRMAETVAGLLWEKLDPKQHIAVLENIMLETKSAYLPLAVILLIERMYGRDPMVRSYEGNKVLTEEDLPKLEELAILKIQEALNSNPDFGSESFGALLQLWELIEPGAAKDWVTTSLNNPSDIVNFVSRYMYNLDNLYIYIEPEELRQRITTHIQKGDFIGEDLQIAEEFLKRDEFFSK